MARAGMALRRGANAGNIDGIDDVQSSIELLDRVLSEFDDVENANQVQNIHQLTGPASTPQQRQQNCSKLEDKNPLLGGPQSEDDGYMSMNARKQKFNLSFKPVPEIPAVHQDENVYLSPIQLPGHVDEEDFPPPPEEAQRLIATLLPKVSPIHCSATNNGSRNRCFPLTQVPSRIETIPPPQKFQNTNEAITTANSLVNGSIDPIHNATQTTLPKTRHQRPYGWENNDFTINPPPPPPGYRFGSLPFQHIGYPLISPTKLPPRTVPTVLERRHREVKRRPSDDDNLSSDLDDTNGLRPLSELADDERFSDDSLEEALPPPPPHDLNTNKRSSIAWEVPLDNDEALLTPGSTKVIGGRRRRKSGGSFSSTNSIPNKLEDDWPDPPLFTTEDEVTTDSDDFFPLPAELVNLSISGSNTYIIRKNKKDRKPCRDGSMTSTSSLNSRLSSSDLSNQNLSTSLNLNSPRSRYSLDLNETRRSGVTTPTPDPAEMWKYITKHSITFDNFKSLFIDSASEKQRNRKTPTPECLKELTPTTPSQVVRVVSLPSLNAEDEDRLPKKEQLGTTVEEEEEEEEEDNSQPSAEEISPLRKIERNITELLERRDIEIENGKFILNGVDSILHHKQRAKRKNQQKPTELSIAIAQNEDHYRKMLLENGSSSPFTARRRIQKSESAKEMLMAHHREQRPITTSTSAGTIETMREFPPLPPSPVEEAEDEYSEIVQHGHGSLKTRSMDANYNRTGRSGFFGTGRNVPSERRTLPTELQDSKRKYYRKRSSQGAPEEISHLQTSCSLPETPIFARGCDVPRTPHRRAPDIPITSSTTGGRQVNTLGSLGAISSYHRRGTFEGAAAGTELLRLAGGPGRGWYPKQRHRRPVSIEHLDRVAAGHNPWESNRKPLTLPPNLTPKFFQRSPRDALRRVTSLLIRKGNNKESKREKDLVSPTIHENANGEEVQKKKGFFKNLWKKSRHYSLEQQ